MCPTYPGNAFLPHLLLLSHDLQFLGQLDLALALCLLCCTAQLLLVLLPQRIQGSTRIPDLGQFVLQALIVHWRGKRHLRDLPGAEHSNHLVHHTACSPERLHPSNANPGVGESPSSHSRTQSHGHGHTAPTYSCAHPAG